MTMDIRHYLTLTLTVGALLLVSCEQAGLFQVGQEEGSTPDAPRYPLEVVPLSASFVDRAPITRGTFAEELPTGYIPYNQLHPTTTPDHTTIGVFMTPERTSTVGNFIYMGMDPTTNLPSNDWKSTITVAENTQYYIYGFMPSEDAETASITPLPGQTDYAAGAIITIHNYNTLTADDVCVISGLRWASKEEKNTGNLTGPVELGKFGYLGHVQGDNHIFVLLEHIYAGLHFKANIDPAYHQLRNINITKVELTAENIYTTGDLTVRLEANDNNQEPVTSVVFETPDNNTGNEDATITLYDAGDGNGYRLTEQISASFLGCFAPKECRSFVLKTTYDVYDRNGAGDGTESGSGNLIRKGCVAENRISDALLHTLNRGDIYTVQLTVMPTYLYVMSDPDLDNPTIVTE